MSRLFARLGAAFVAPAASAAGGEQRAAFAATPPAPAVAVLCRPRDALAIGGASALLLATRGRSPHALLAIWCERDCAPAEVPGHAPAMTRERRGPRGPVAVSTCELRAPASAAPTRDMRGPRAPARASARRLVATLSARGHQAFATGRLAVVSLAAHPSEAAAEAVRAGAAAGDVPTVTVLAGPRDPAADGLLRAQEAILVAAAAEADPAVAELAVRGLEPLGVPARAIAVPGGSAHARALAAAGVAVVPPLRSAVEAALERPV
jgi:hypothetical protein